MYKLCIITENRRFMKGLNNGQLLQNLLVTALNAKLCTETVVTLILPLRVEVMSYSL